MKKFSIYFLCMILLNLSAPAQQNQAAPKKDEQPPEIQRLNEFSRIVSPRIFAAEKNGNALTVLDALRALKVEYPPASKAFEYGMLMTFLKEQTIKLGNYRDALAFEDFNGEKFPDNPAIASELKDYRPFSAVEAIAEASAGQQAVIVNEAHHVPQHRALTIELLKKLKQKGFTYFAAETLFETDAKLNERGYPIRSTGAYIDEPLYGDIIRTALKLGYKVVPYESHGGGPDARERGQAENLKNRIFSKDAQAKVLIHVGYGHNSEATHPNGTKLMAGYLKEFTGIDSLTIDQTVMSERSAPEYEHPLYRYLAAHGDLAEPTVFRNSRKEFWTSKDSGRDITIFSPRSAYAGGRPSWLALGGERKPYTLPADLCKTEKYCLVRARFAAESTDAVPIDQIEYRETKESVLMLPKGDFNIEVENAAGKLLKSWRVKR